MLIPPQIKTPHRKRVKVTAKTQAAALTLVAAEYIAMDGTFLRLTFDRAVDVAGMVGSQITVDDAINLGERFAATGAVTVESPTRVLVVLDLIGDSTGSGTTLDAGAGNGIVAADDGGTWAGVSELGLPYP